MWATTAWLLGILALLPGRVNAAAPGTSAWIARVWQASDGLTDNRISGIVQTPDGYLWIATLGKLVRFNGSAFEEFQVSAVPGVTGQGPRTMFVDAAGDLWLSAVRGQLLHVTPRDVSVYDGSNGVPPEPLSGLAQSSSGTWLAFGSHLFRFNGDRLEPVSLPGENTGPVALGTDDQHRVWCAQGSVIGVLEGLRFRPLHQADGPVILARASGGGMWACSSRRLQKLSQTGEATASVDLPAPVHPTALLQDASGGVWVGTIGRGLLRVEHGRINSVETSHLHITALLEDREGSIWAGTRGGGLNRLRRRTVTLTGPRLSAPFESVVSVAEDPSGAVWVATGSGHLLRNTGESWTAAEVEGAPSASVTAVVFDRNDNLWFGTLAQGLFCGRLRADGSDVVKASFLPGAHVRALFAASDGSVWCATEGPTQVVRFTNGAAAAIPLPPKVRVVRGITEDRDGTIWIGTSDGQVLRAGPNGFVADPVLAAAAPFSVRALHATRDGSLWIGYAVQGIGRWRDGVYSRLMVDAGLPDDAIYQIMSDRDGRLWAACPQGIYQFRLVDPAPGAPGQDVRVTARIVGRDEGLPDIQAQFDNQPATCVKRDGTLLFATSIGLVAVNPGQLPADSAPPPVVIERAVIDEQTVALRGSESPLRAPPFRQLKDLAVPAPLRIPPGHRRLQFDFAALRFADIENLRFQYRLDGFDNAWIDPGRERSAQYSRLPPGSYTLRVRVNSGSATGAGTSAALALVVEPFYWQTWWFRGTCVVLFTLIVVAIVRIVSFQRLRNQLRLAEQRAAVLQERTRIARDIHDDLGGTLTHIKLLSELAAQGGNPPEATGPQLRQITDASRAMLKSLDETIWAINPRNDRLPDLISYVGQHAVQFLRAAGIACEVDLPDSPADMPVRSEIRHHVFLVVKEALTNVVRHAAATRVLVRATLEDRTLTIVIADNGRGFSAPSDSPFSDGVKNMRHRMESVGGTLTVESGKGQGTSITLRVDVS